MLGVRCTDQEQPAEDVREGGRRDVVHELSLFPASSSEQIQETRGEDSRGQGTSPLPGWRSLNP